MKKTNPTSFIIHHDFEAMFRLLPMEQRGMLITAIFEYCIRGHETEDLPEAANMAFCCIKRVLERDSIAYQERCRINSENGKKGGRPRKNSPPSQTQWFFQETKKPYSDSDSESDSDSDSDSVSDSDSGSDRVFCTPSVPPTSSAPGSAAPQEEKEKEELVRMGVPRDYLNARWNRARSYARSHGGSVKDTLLSWWQEDQTRRTSPPSTSSPSPNKSYDLDDFFEAALARSYESLEGA